MPGRRTPSRSAASWTPGASRAGSGPGLPGHGDALFNAKRWCLRSSGPKPGQRQITITSVREHGEGIVAKAEGIDDRSAAEQLRGWELHLSRSEFPEAGDGEYYWVDLIGLDVVNRDGAALGRVIGLIDTGPHCVFRIAPSARSSR